MRVEDLQFQCVFCGMTVERRGLDPCAVLVGAEWLSKQFERSQQFFCHAACFQTAARAYQSIDVFSPEWGT